MIKSFCVMNDDQISTYVDLFNPYESGFAVDSITGLSSGNAEIRMSESMAFDGSSYNSARRPSRNIVFNLLFVGNDVEKIRHKSYKMFPVKEKVSLYFETDSRLLYINGIVESNETDIFSENEGCTVSIICPKPDFISVFNQRTDFIEKKKAFEFPFSNNQNEKNIIMADQKTFHKKTIVYDGDSSVGMNLIFNFYGDCGNITISRLHLSNYCSMTINTDKIKKLSNILKISDGDSLIVSTERGSKSAFFLHGENIINVISSIKVNPKWLTFFKGVNVMSYDIESDINNVSLSIENKILYSGL